MPDQFDNFTEQARMVLQLAQEEAQRFNHTYMGTEHLLLGLIRVREGTAAQVLGELGVELDHVRGAVEFIMGRGDRTITGDRGLTPRARTVIELAVDTARQLDHHSVDTEHLLLGLLREGEGIAAGVLESLGVTVERAWTKTLDVLAVQPDQRPRPPPASHLPESTRKGVRHSPQGRSTLGSAQPADRFDKFTERARRVLQYAAEEGQRLRHASIRPEHLLLGLVREGDGVAAKVLSNLGVQLEVVRVAVEQSAGHSEESVAGSVALSNAAKRVIELSVDEARRLNHHYIGTEHLLLGLARGGEGMAGSVLESLDVSLEKVRSQVIYVLNQPMAHSYQPGWAGSTVYSPSVPSLTTGASRALEEAGLVARWFHHREVGTGHLLVGLVREHDGLAARALREVGVTEGLVTAQLEHLVARGEPSGRVAEGLSAGAEQVLDDARHVAAGRAAGPIGTEHLLLGLLAAADDEPVQVLLRELGTTPSVVRAAVEHLLPSR